MRFASFTPARSNCMGTRVFTRTGPWESAGSSDSTITRRYLRLKAGRESTAGAVSRSRAAMSRSASSAVILPAASISRTWRRVSLIESSPSKMLISPSKDVHQHRDTVVDYFDLCSAKSGQHAQQRANCQERVELREKSGDEQDGNDEHQQRQHQYPEQQKGNRQTEAVHAVIADPHSSCDRDHGSASSSRMASAALISQIGRAHV